MKNVDKEFEAMVKDCKRNKLSESLLMLNKALYLQSTISSSAVASGSAAAAARTAEIKNEQKILVEVR